MLTKLISTSLIVGAFLVGCGGETKVKDTQDVSMPHQIDMTPKTSREFDPGSEEYLNFMTTYDLNSVIYKVYYDRETNIPKIALNDYAHRDQNLKYVFYIDTDHNKQTGYYDPWAPKVGADYLVEGGILYKYTGTAGSHEWSWEVINWNAGSVQNESGITLIDENGIKLLASNLISYGITLNQDWTQNSFLGYFYTSLDRNNKERKVSFSEQTDREFTISRVGGNDYLHSYKKDHQKLNINEKYYNYTFKVNGIIYHTQGNKLFNENWELIKDNLLYEVREYDTITIIPNDYRISNITIVTVRNDDWTKLFSVDKLVAPLFEKVKDDIKNKDGNPKISFTKMMTESNKILVGWAQDSNEGRPGFYANLSVYDVDGENVSFNKHILYQQNIDYNRAGIRFRGKMLDTYLIRYTTDTRYSTKLDFLIDSNGNRIANVSAFARKNNILFVPVHNYLRIVDLQTHQVSKTTFDNFYFPRTQSENISNEIDGNILTFTHRAYRYIETSGITKFDISDINDIKLIYHTQDDH